MPSTNIGPWERVISVAAGAFLAQKCMTGSGVRRGVFGVLSAELVRRGVTGHCYANSLMRIQRQGSSTATIQYEEGIPLQCAVTIDRPQTEIFSYWRDLSNLPKFMERVQAVEVLDNTRSRWTMRGPATSEFQWDAEIHNEIENELIGWRTVGPSEVRTAGSVRFRPAPGDRGTEVIVKLQYIPPAGKVGQWVSTLLGFSPAFQLTKDMMRLKQVLECGQITDNEDQTSGRSEMPSRRKAENREVDMVGARA